MTQRYDGSKCFWKNDANRLAQGRVAINFQVKQNKTHSMQSTIKQNTRYVYISIFHVMKIKHIKQRHVKYKQHPNRTNTTENEDWWQWGGSSRKYPKQNQKKNRNSTSVSYETISSDQTINYRPQRGRVEVREKYLKK